MAILPQGRQHIVVFDDLRYVFLVEQLEEFKWFSVHHGVPVLYGHSSVGHLLGHGHTWILIFMCIHIRNI